MDSALKGLPFDFVIQLNIYVSIIGLIFIRSVKKTENNKADRKLFSFFWLLNVVYYFFRSVYEYLNLGMKRISTFLAQSVPATYHPIDINGVYWIFLVVINDLCFLTLFLAMLKHESNKNRLIIFLTVAYAIVWIIEANAGYNGISSFINVAFVLYIGYKLKDHDIKNSLAIMAFAFLILPYSLFGFDVTSLQIGIFFSFIALKFKLIEITYKKIKG